MNQPKSFDKLRCFGQGKELYTAYHDTEWGIPEHNDQKLFEMLILEGAQAGLTWESILKRREGYRAAFHNFDSIKVASMSDHELSALMANPNIIRNRLKIYGARQNARVFLTIQKEFGSFDQYLWQFVRNKPIINNPHSMKDVPPFSKESTALSRDLKKRGMTFVGPTIMYAFMQAIGMVDDHIVACWKKGK